MLDLATPIAKKTTSTSTIAATPTNKSQEKIESEEDDIFGDFVEEATPDLLGTSVPARQVASHHNHTHHYHGAPHHGHHHVTHSFIHHSFHPHKAQTLGTADEEEFGDFQETNSSSVVYNNSKYPVQYSQLLKTNCASQAHKAASVQNNGKQDPFTGGCFDF